MVQISVLQSTAVSTPVSTPIISFPWEAWLTLKSWWLLLQNVRFVSTLVKEYVYVSFSARLTAKFTVTTVVAENVEKTDRKRYAEKNSNTEQQKKRHKKERSWKCKRKLIRKENTSLKRRKKVRNLQSKLENASVIIEGETGSLLHQFHEIFCEKRFNLTKYNNYIREVVVNIMYHSPAAYSYLWNTLKLPHAAALE